MVCHWICAPDPHAQRLVELGDWQQLLLWAQWFSGWSVVPDCRKRKRIPGTRCIVWDASLPADRLFKQLNCAVMASTLLILWLSVLQGKNGQSQEMSYFLSLWAAAISKPLHPPITQGWAFAQSVHFSQWHVSLTENRIPIPLCAVTFAVTSHFLSQEGTLRSLLTALWFLVDGYKMCTGLHIHTHHLAECWKREVGSVKQMFGEWVC